MSRIEQWMELAGATDITESGEQYIARCPFHSDSKRSFSVNPDTGQFICYAESCGEYGGLYALLVRGCGFSPKRARRLAEEFGAFDVYGGRGDDWVELPDWDKRKEEPKEREGMQERLLGLYDFCPTMMRERGFSKETLRRWEVGFDFETDRITFPVRAKDGTLMGLTKRATKASQAEKYLHLNYKKSRVLYGEHLVVDRKATVYVSEGNADTIAIDQMLRGHALAGSSLGTLGSRVSQKQIALIAKYRDVVLAFDHDRDGIAATMKVGEGLLERGRVARVAARYPKGVKDPAELLEKRGDRVARFLRKVEPFDVWRLRLM